ncbi:hypothetical protein [Thiomicrorhabdus cannonii]|uniref:hypothetical protein n=1 Tax=Thiomicrorhabdus cannonii TaxID=2748011 RepID=UPI0015BEC355|nr:hypothetical protein [Thiomicrorhabdus cannonii]
MSNIDLEQDDKATLEMLAMMGELPNEKVSDDDGELEVDALLDAINNASATESETALEIDEPSVMDAEVGSDYAFEATQPEDLPSENDNLDDIDAMLNDIDSLAQNDESETALDLDNLAEPPTAIDDEIEASFSAASLEEDALPDADGELENAMLAAEPAPSFEDELPAAESVDNLLEEELEELEEIEEESALSDDIAIGESLEAVETGESLEAVETGESLEASLPEEDALSEESPLSDETPTVDSALPASNLMAKDEDDAAENARIVQQAADTIVNMEDALSIDQEIQKIAAEVRLSAQEATRLALATTRKAHESAEKTQQAIEATFAAAERAFEAAKQAGYELQNEGLGELLSSSEIDEQLAAIREKNAQLKTVNESIKKRIAELKSY